MFSDTLKKLRKEKKLTQIELAKKLNVANGTIGNWESGNRQPDYSTLEKLADFFNVTTDYLLGREDKEKNTTLNEQLSGIECALLSEIRDLTDEEKLKILDFAKFVKSMRYKK